MPLNPLSLHRNKPTLTELLAVIDKELVKSDANTMESAEFLSVDAPYGCYDFRDDIVSAYQTAGWWKVEYVNGEYRVQDKIHFYAFDENAPASAAPVVSLVLESTVIDFGTQALFTASATDSDGTVVSMSLYDGTTLLTTVQGALLEYAWSGATVGTHAMKVKATDNTGVVGTSNTVSLTVQAVPVVAPPILTGFSLTSALPGASVSLYGSNFTQVTNFFFAGFTATPYAVLSDTELTFTVPDYLPGNFTTIVYYPGGYVESNFTFQVQAVPVVTTPTITGFSPAAAAVGDTLTITGTNLNTVTAFQIGFYAVSSFTVVNATTCTLTIPSGALNNCAVIAIYNGSFTSAPTQLTVSAPVVVAPVATSFSPPVGGDGTVVTVLGSGLNAVQSVNIGGLGLGTNVQHPDDNTLVFTVGRISASSAPLLLVVGNDAYPTAQSFTIPLPTMNIAFSSTQVTLGETITVTLTGTAYSAPLFLMGVITSDDASYYAPSYENTYSFSFTPGHAGATYFTGEVFDEIGNSNVGISATLNVAEPVVATNQTVRFYAIGNSLDAGEGSTNAATKAWLPQMVTSMNNPNYSFANYAQGGQVTAGYAAQIASAIADKATHPADLYIAFIGSETNDLTQGVSNATIEATLQQLHAQCHAAGILTIDYTNTPYALVLNLSIELREIKRQDIRSFRRANWAAWGASAMVDVAADPTIGVLQVPYDPVYFTDGCHQTDAGYAIKAALMRPAAQAVIAGTTYGAVVPYVPVTGTGDLTEGTNKSPNLSDAGSQYTTLAGIVDSGETIQETDNRWQLTGTFTTVINTPYHEGAGKASNLSIAGIKINGSGFNYAAPIDASIDSEIFVDGVSYGRAGLASGQLTVTGLVPGVHTLVVKPMGGMYCVIDQLTVTGQGVVVAPPSGPRIVSTGDPTEGTGGGAPFSDDGSQYTATAGIVAAGESVEETDPRWHYAGTFTNINNSNYHGGSGTYTNVGIASIKINGTGFTIQQPISTVIDTELLVDGVSLGRLGLSSGKLVVTGLTPGVHNLSLRNIGTTNFMVVDYLSVDADPGFPLTFPVTLG